MSLKLNKVLISDAVDASCRKILEDNGVSVDYKPGLSKDDLLATIKVWLERPRGHSCKVSSVVGDKLGKMTRVLMLGKKELPLWYPPPHTHTHTHTHHSLKSMMF